MRKKPLLAVALALGIWQLAAVARAQQDNLWPETQQPPQQEKTLWGRLSDFGQSVFGAPSASRPSDNATRPAPQPVAATSPGNVPAGQPPATASPGTGQMTPARGSPAPICPTRCLLRRCRRVIPAGVPTRRRTRLRRARVGRVTLREIPRPWAMRRKPIRRLRPGPPRRRRCPRRRRLGGAASSAPELSLHERLQGFRESVFGDNSPKKAEVADPAGRSAGDERG